jgi:hypothetical protein
MNVKISELLNLRRLPGRMCAEQAAPVLGFQTHDLPILVRAKLLMPLGNPRPNATKYFDAQQITVCAADTDWLNQATRALYRYWDRQNQRRREQCDGAMDKLAA